MKKLLLIAILLFQFQPARSSHVLGAALTFECQGNGTYKFRYTFYRDCFGIPAPQSVTMTITNNCGFPVQTQTLYMLSIPTIQIIPVCASNPTTCNGGTSPGVEKYIYEGTFTFGAECDWAFGVSMSSRNAAITTLVNPDAENLFVSASLNNTNNICDASPVFNAEPEIYVCKNQQYCLDISATDADGDSLVYALVAPKSDWNQVVPYDSGYSVSSPISFNQPFNINSSTGQLCFIATQQNITVHAVMVSEYRNQVLIGQVERDVELRTMNCSGNQPMLSGINGSSVDVADVCALNPICFDIFSNDFDANDSTTISWDHSITGATFTPSGNMHDDAFFCWTPDLTDIRNTPYCFTVNVRDNSCIALQSNTRIFCITVYDPATTGCAPLATNNINSSFNSMRIFPQPANDFISIDFGRDVSKEYFLRIENYLGKQVFESELTGQVEKINCNDNFPSGIYFALLVDKNGNAIGKTKFIVLK